MEATDGWMHARLQPCKNSDQNFKSLRDSLSHLWTENAPLRCLILCGGYEHSSRLPSASYDNWKVRVVSRGLAFVKACRGCHKTTGRYFYVPCSPVQERAQFCLKVSRLEPPVSLETILLRSRRIWNNGGMILSPKPGWLNTDRGNPKYCEKTLSLLPLCPPQFSHGLDRASAVTGRHSYKLYPKRSKHTPSPLQTSIG